MPLEQEDGFLKVWEKIWDFQKSEKVQILEDIEIKKNIYLETSTPFIIMFGIVGSFIFLINLSVVTSCGLILKQRQGTRSTYWLLGNISLSDMISGCVLISKLASLLFPESETAAIRCDISIAVCVASGMNSIYCVAFIAIDRYLYIVHGLQYNRLVTPMRLKIIILLSWMNGIFLGVLPFMLWNSDAKAGGRVCLLITTVNPTFLLIMGIFAAVPMATAWIFQGLILYHAITNIIKLKTCAALAEKKLSYTPSNKLMIFRGHNRLNDSNEKTMFSQTEKSHRQSIRINNPSKMKAIKVVLFTTGSMMITMIPYLITCLLFTTCDPVLDQDKCKRLKYIAGMPLYLLMLSNCFMNPIIYAWWHKGFRDSLKKIYLSKLKRDQLTKQLEMSIMERANQFTSVKTLQSQTSMSSSSTIIVTHL